MGGRRDRGASGVALVLMGGLSGVGCGPPTYEGEPGCPWLVTVPRLTLPRQEVFGTLAGVSRTAGTSCGTAAGPEAVYLLELPERRLVDLRLNPSTDMVVSIRRNCADPATEVACDPEGLRKILDPGRYFVLVDQVRASGLRANYSLQASAVVPPADASCAGARVVGQELSLVAESFDLAAEPAPSCNGGPSRAAIYHRATIPSGQRLTARAIGNGGDRRWTPVLQLLSGCGPAATCLASDRLAEDGSTLLRYVNNGPRDQEVIVTVGATSFPADALFDLVINVSRPLQNQTCQTAAPLSDGLVLSAQDLSEGGIDPGGRCGRAGRQSLFYRATLQQRQTLQLTLDRRMRRPFGDPLLEVIVRDGCDPADCGQKRNVGEVLTLAHVDPGARTYIIELSGIMSPPPRVLFDLSVRLAPPLGLGPAPAPLALPEATGRVE
jgi:hypothetical protein